MLAYFPPLALSLLLYLCPFGLSLLDIFLDFLFLIQELMPLESRRTHAFVVPKSAVDRVLSDAIASLLADKVRRANTCWVNDNPLW